MTSYRLRLEQNMQENQQLSEIQIFPVDREEWYLRLIDDLKGIATEGEFTARFALVEAYHEFGTRILSENANFERLKVYGKEVVRKIAESIGKSERLVYYAIAFAKKYPSLNDLPEGKNTSWSKICKQLLSAPSDDTKPAPIVIEDKMLLRKIVEENMDYLLEYSEPTDKGYKFFISRDRLISYYNVAKPTN